MDEERPNRLEELRWQSRESQAEVAAALGVSQVTVSKWERGKHPIPDAMKLALSRRYRVSVSWLMRWDEEEVAGVG